MRLKLIIALVNDHNTDIVVDAARAGGATGATIVSSVRGEGLKPEKTFFGLGLAAKRDVVMFLVADTRARDILERIRTPPTWRRSTAPESHSKSTSRMLWASPLRCLSFERNWNARYERRRAYQGRRPHGFRPPQR